MTYYKILNSDGSAIYGSGSWHLPKGKRPGKWMDRIDNLEVCERGYHLARKGDLVGWLGPRVFEAEVRGEIIESDDKVVVEQARLVQETNWNDSIARLFACDCAERVLHLYEKQYPNDSRVRDCVETARKVANGDLPVVELAAAEGAARDAAWAAARDVAWDAARAAAWAARAAARDVAWDAAEGAARAARAAARDVAWAAAWAAAEGAAEGAARDAAEGAEREWQTERLFQYLEGAA